MKNSYQTILKMNHKAAKRFLLDPESYCGFGMPSYFNFERMLTKVDKHLKQKALPSLTTKSKLAGHEDVNHTILINKDGKYAWRPFQLIHPALYVSLIHTITEKKNWNTIKTRFSEFSSDDKIQCLSIPVKSRTKTTDRGQQILVWWSGIEQKSIELTLEYEYLFQTDIENCYGSLYTHSIPWALHTRKKAKKNRSTSLLGNCIDRTLQGMAQGQTNGIPQGSVAMDFIAEMVLGYADLDISRKLDSNIDYKILRFRDDYRIFVTNPRDGEVILKAITETMIDLGMKLNPSKTMMSNQTVRSSVKLDKLSWMAKQQTDKNLQKHLLLIHSHAGEFPNSGSLVIVLFKFSRRIEKMTDKQFKHVNFMALVSIVIDIASNSPRVYPQVIVILSKLLVRLNDVKKQQEVIEKILTRFSRMPNTNYLEIWLQRISVTLGDELQSKEPLCRLVAGEDENIWNSDWISCKKLRNLVKPKRIIDWKKMKKMGMDIPSDEIQLFPY